MATRPAPGIRLVHIRKLSLGGLLSKYLPNLERLFSKSELTIRAIDVAKPVIAAGFGEVTNIGISKLWKKKLSAGIVKTLTGLAVALYSLSNSKLSIPSVASGLAFATPLIIHGLIDLASEEATHEKKVAAEIAKTRGNLSALAYIFSPSPELGVTVVEEEIPQAPRAEVYPEQVIEYFSEQTQAQSSEEEKRRTVGII